MNYDEAIKEFKRISDIKILECLKHDFYISYQEILKTLETAKKEHELLGLYKEKDKYPDDSNQCRDICIKITELERELK